METLLRQFHRASAPLALSAFLVLGAATPCLAGGRYQDFEPNNGSSTYGSAVNGVVISLVDRHEAVHLGRSALKTDSWGYWGGVAVFPQGGIEELDFQSGANDRLTFWVYPLPDRACFVYGCGSTSDNNVGVTFFDNGAYASSGFQVWTAKTARYGQWTPLTVLFSQLPSDLDLRHIQRLEFINYWPGRYYFDDLHAVREDRVYQAFEPGLRSGSTAQEYGWKWNDADTVDFSTGNEPVHEGSHSWKLISTQRWGGTGIQSQEQKLDTGAQTFWHVDLNPAQNDRLTFWVYALPENGLDNDVGVQFYDHGAHFTDETKAVAWTTGKARYGRWTRLSVRFSDLPATLNLRDLNKIQFQHYWPGTYYLDDIRATGTTPEIEPPLLPQGIVRWTPINGADHYRLQESTAGPDGPWVTIYEGTAIGVQVNRLNRTWYRVRWEDPVAGSQPPPYASQWSDVAESVPPPVLLSAARLRAGVVEWNAIPQTDRYEVQQAPSAVGPWSPFYLGAPPVPPLAASVGMWYRVRALREENGTPVDLTAWSPPRAFQPPGGFLRAVGTVLKDRDGAGDEVVLRGVNLGGFLLIEKWMTGLGAGDQPEIEDDWTIRQTLAGRFGETAARRLIKTYQDAYLQDLDLDRLRELGVNLVRLPIFYRILQHDDGTWVTDEHGAIDFGVIDRIVEACADHGIYVLLDLHGAPGAQSPEFHTGRAGFNKLFKNNAAGQAYRDRTVQLWEALARHYKDEPMVAGYDLLNEPTGAPTPQTLWALYDRLYDAIRAIDANHLIVMEGIFDWDTLPPPADQDWENVLYQFHYYNFGHDDDYASHAAFIDAKVAEGQLQQPAYQVPVMIGEFNAFSLRQSWDYYLQQFNQQGWSWALWTYKVHFGPSNWGLYVHSGYDETLPVFRGLQQSGAVTGADSFETLARKLAKYDTVGHHDSNLSLIEAVHAEIPPPPRLGTAPEITSIYNIASGGNAFSLRGMNFGPTQGSSTVTFEEEAVPVYAWSDAAISGYVPADRLAGKSSGILQAHTDQGLSNEAILAVVPGPTAASVSGEGDETIYTGVNFGDLEGTVSFAPWICTEIPPGGDQCAPCNANIPCNRGQAAVTKWTDTEVRFVRPPDACPSEACAVNVGPPFAQQLGAYVALAAENLPPSLQPIGDRTVDEGRPISFSVGATDPDGDPLTYTAAPLPAGATFTNQTFSWMPGADQAGPHPVTFTVSDGQLSDAEPVTIQVGNSLRPDLKLTALSSDKTKVAPGKKLRASHTVKNIGQAASGGFRIAFFLSRNAAPATEDVVFTTTQLVSALAPGQRASAAPRLTVPPAAPLGAYHLCARADSGQAVEELDEANNVRCASSTIHVTRPDLVVTAVSGPTRAFRGTVVQITHTLKNNGAAPTGASSALGLYLSKDRTITSADRRIGSRLMPNLAAGISMTSASFVIIPTSLPRGTYYVGAVADYTNRVVESNEANNGLAGNKVVIR